MITQIFDRHAAVGKTILGFVLNGDQSKWIILFQDNTFLLLSAIVNDDDAEINSNYPFNVLNFGSKIIVDAGLMTWQEVNAAHQAKYEADQAIREAHDRRTYEMLKAKYGE